jgi:outer membrane protein OmpA-like peptidoglycan-associated protein
MPRTIFLYTAAAVAALFLGGATPSMAQIDQKMCNPVVDGSGKPVVLTDGRIVLFGGSVPCPEEVAEVAPVAVATPAPVVVLPNNGTVFFDLDAATLATDQESALADIVTAVQDANPTAVTVDGYADTTGTPEHNMTLSEQRAANIAAALAAAGIPSTAITSTGHGEADLAVPTEDGVAMRENRRVVIDLGS